MRSILLLCLLFAGWMACKDRPAARNESPFKRTDSLQILYYDDPDGDSLRYTRFYQYLDSKDTTVINALVGNLQQPLEKRDSIKDCRSEGKIYLYNKGQEAIKTVYFSTRCDTCCYLYYIEEGVFYYSKLSDKVKRQLQENKARSHK